MYEWMSDVRNSIDKSVIKYETYINFVNLKENTTLNMMYWIWHQSMHQFSNDLTYNLVIYIYIILILYRFFYLIQFIKIILIN